LDFPEKSENSQWTLPSFDLKDYGIQLYQQKAEIGLLLVHKKENSLYFAQNNDFGKFKQFSVAVAFGNSAVFFDKYGDPTFLSPEKDFEVRYKKVGDILFTKPLLWVGGMVFFYSCGFRLVICNSWDFLVENKP
jgi:hypothetical protein